MNPSVSQSSISNSDKKSHDPKDKEIEKRKLKSSTSFVHRPQARSHKAVSQVTTRAANVQGGASCNFESESGFLRQQHIGRDDYKARPRHDHISTYQNKFKCLGREVGGPSFRQGPSAGGCDCGGRCQGLEAMDLLVVEGLWRRSWRPLKSCTCAWCRRHVAVRVALDQDAVDGRHGWRCETACKMAKTCCCWLVIRLGRRGRSS